MINFTGMKDAKKILGYLLLAFLFFSCSRSLKELTYIHDVETDRYYPNVPLPDSYKIRPNDHLFINVIGEDKLQTDFLNTSYTGFGGSSNAEFILYLVDENGNISYPQLGELQVAGKTILDVRDMVQERVDEYIIGTSVQVKLVNRTFTILGDVKNPGLQPMIKNQFTIFEALGSAGDVNDFGNRKNLKLIRETPEGKRVKEIDLTDPELLTSEYFYIQPNDVIYVEPNKYRVYSVKTMPWLSQVTFGASLITTALLLINLFK